MIVVVYFLAFARLDILEKDGKDYNHLLSFRYPGGKEMLLSWVGPVPLGDESTNMWVHIHDMECKPVSTSELTSGPIPVPLSGTVHLCTASYVRNDE